TSALLAQGIQDVSNALVAEQVNLNDVLRMILETMFRAMSFRLVLLCLRDARTGTLQGRLGLGDGGAEAARLFKVDLSDAHNLFSLVSNKGLDTLIHQTADAKVMQNLPAWYRQGIHAGSFMLLPLQLKGAPFGLIYADKAQADSIVLDDKGLSLLKTLRNQAVMAFRQAQRG
ncbi:MAG: serine/threonine protein kinase, partial [Burkholderiales bacterium]|nr:serine/threonine protein kinase [Burkholderiales bacterium]